MSIINNFFDALEGTWENRLDNKWEDNFGCS